MIGRTITHYQVTAKLGEGGMGEVYQARDTKLDREVAIKVLPRAMAENKRALARFEREAKALAALNHPNIAHVHGYDSDKGLFFLVMELVEGETLAERLRKGPLSVSQSLKIMRQVAQALEAAHEKGIIHRDLKPSNIKFTADDRVKVLDFGLAKILAVTATDGDGDRSDQMAATEMATVPDDRTSPGAVLGTVAYMSPEQARGESVNQGADIWAWGCCLFECLTGKKPFRAKTVADLIAELLKKEPDWSLLPADTPDAVRTVLHRCLEKEENQRLSSMGDIALTLEEISEMLHPRPQSKGSQARSPSASAIPLQAFPWWKMAGMVGAALMLVLLIVFLKNNQGSSRKNSSPEKIRSLAVLPFDTETNEPDLVLIAGGMADDIRTQLRRIERLDRQIGSRTVKQYENSDKGDQAIAFELDVDGLVYGRVKRAGDALSIQIELVHGPTANLLWTTNITSSNIKELQAWVVLSLLNQFKVELSGEERAFVSRTQDVGHEAFVSYRKGLAAQNRNSAAGFAESQKHFQKAVELAPDYASPYLRMVGNAVLAPLWGGLMVPPAAGQEQGRDILSKAVSRLGATNSELQSAEFWLDMSDQVFSWDEEEGDMLMALDADPQSPDAHAIKSWYLNVVMANFEEAREAIQEALKFEDDLRHDELRSEIYRFHGHYRDSIDISLALYKESPDWERLEDISYSYRMLEDWDNASEYARRAVEESGGNPVALLALAEAHAGLGDVEQARNILGQVQSSMEEGTYVPSLALAGVYYRLGDKDKAFELMEEGFQKREGLSLLWLHSRLWMDLVGKDSRYWKFIDRMNFPPLPPEHPFHSEEQKMRFRKGV